MRKNKKLFAILTLVAFMMTLVPALAFASISNTYEITNAEVGADGTVTFTTTTTGDKVFAVLENGTLGAEITSKKTAVSVREGEKYIAVDGSASQGDGIPSGAPVFTVDEALANKSQAVAFVNRTEYTTWKSDETTIANANALYAVYANLSTSAQAAVTEAVASNDKEAFQQAMDAGVATTAWATYDSSKTAANLIAFGNAYNAIANNANAVVGFEKVVNKTDAATARTFVSAAKAYDDYANAATKTAVLLNSAASELAKVDAAELEKAADIAAEEVVDVLRTQKMYTAWNTWVASPTNAVNYGKLLNVIDEDAAATNKVSSDVKEILPTDMQDAFAVIADVAGSGTAPINDVNRAAALVSDVEIEDPDVEEPAIETDISIGASVIATKDENISIESAGNAANKFPASSTNYAEIELALKQPSLQNSVTGATVYVWVEQSGKSNQASDAFVIKNTDLAAGVTVSKIKNSGKAVGNIYRVDCNGVAVTTLQTAFLRGGEYKLMASTTNPTVDSTTSALKDVATFNGNKNTNKSSITVTAPTQISSDFVVEVRDAKGNLIETLADGDISKEFVKVSADTVATTKVNLIVFKNKDKETQMTTYPVSLSTNSANIELDKTSLTTDYNGAANFNIAGLREGQYKLYIKIGDYESTMKIQVGATIANDIQLIKFPSAPIATDTDVDDYANLFRFQLTDANGNIVADKAYPGAEYAALKGETSVKSLNDQAKYAYIVSAPTANKVKNADLFLKYVDDKDYYTLGLASGKSFSAEGDYEIRVVLNNGKSATLNFSVKKFDKAVSLHIEYPTQAVELNSKTDVPDIYFLDANGVVKKANKRVTVAASGYAVASVDESGATAGQIKVKNDEKYVGQTITVTAVSDKENLMATTTLTVADEAKEVRLDSTRGQVNANNRVGFKIVDSTGHPVALGNEVGVNNIDVTAVVVNTGDQDAKVSYSVSGSSKADLLSNGTGIINLSSNKETTATVQIMVKVTKNKADSDNSGNNNTGLSTTYYSGTATYTFGAEASKSVVMTIGSKEIVTNNVPTATDVAPFIKDNRTWVPFRALTEAFGAEVDYNAENNTVTAKLNGKTVVLTVGSTVLTVNDEAVTMDVAPYIVDDRVVVPVRFVGEAFGFTVEATQDDATGATASVVFYQK